MKRYLVIISCLSILYAGIVWSLEGCRAFGEAWAGDHQSQAGNSHHHPDTDSHHSHSDSSEVHCQNPLAAFVSSPRIALERERGWTMQVAGMSFQMRSSLNSVVHHGLGLGPPDPELTAPLQRFLLLSVFRI